MQEVQEERLRLVLRSVVADRQLGRSIHCDAVYRRPVRLG